MGCSRQDSPKGSVEEVNLREFFYPMKCTRQLRGWGLAEVIARDRISRCFLCIIVAVVFTFAAASRTTAGLVVSITPDGAGGSNWEVSGTLDLSAATPKVEILSGVDLTRLGFPGSASVDDVAILDSTAPGGFSFYENLLFAVDTSAAGADPDFAANGGVTPGVGSAEAGFFLQTVTASAANFYVRGIAVDGSVVSHTWSNSSFDIARVRFITCYH